MNKKYEMAVNLQQDFTAAEQTQGRNNIGAASASDVAALQSQVSSLSDVSAYSVKGEATVAQLNAGPSGIQAGWAYQLTDSGTLTEGTLAVVAGDTVAWDGTKWFPLVKSDYYATKTYAQNVAHSIATKFDKERSYSPGEVVIYDDGVRYSFVNNHTGDWNANDAIAIPESCTSVTWEHCYYGTNGSSPNRAADNSRMASIIDVAAGTKVFVSGSLSSTALPWATIDANGNFVRKAASASVAEVVTIQAAEKKILVQSNVSSFKNLIVGYANTFGSSVGVLQDTILRLVPTNGIYYDCSGTKLPAFPSNQSNYSAGIVYAFVGNTFLYKGSGSANAVPVATFDVDGNFVRKFATNYTTTPLEFTIQDGEVGFVFNGITSGLLCNRSNSSVCDDLYLLKKFADGNRFSKDVSIDKINQDFSVKLNCGKKFSMQCLFRMSKSFAKNPAGANLYIGNFGGVNMYMRSQAIEQYTSTFVDSSSNTKTSYHPWLVGGISPAGPYMTGNRFVPIAGDLAFSIKYVGNGTAASIKNDGTALVLSEDGVETSFTLADYSTMKELYEAIVEETSFEFGFMSLEGRTPDDLVIFPEVQLVSEFKRVIEQGSSVQTEYTDAAPFFVQYADDSWHTFEVFCLEDTGKLYSSFDGLVYPWADRTVEGDVTFSFYSTTSGNSFKDVSIHTNDIRDIELVNDTIDLNRLLSVSSFNPLNVIFEGHQIADDVSGDSLDLGTTTDRLASVFELYKKKGYIPVSLDEVIDSYNGGKKLPKRSMSVCFDDYRFGDVLNIATRRSLTSQDIKFALAVITGRSSETVTYEGETITFAQAVDMVHLIGGKCYTHTKGHTNLDQMKYSELPSVLIECIKDADLKNISSMMLVYPYGSGGSQYSFKVMESLGMRAGLYIAPGLNMPARAKFCLRRIEIGERATWESIVNACL